MKIMIETDEEKNIIKTILTNTEIPAPKIIAALAAAINALAAGIGKEQSKIIKPTMVVNPNGGK